MALFIRSEMRRNDKTGSNRVSDQTYLFEISDLKAKLWEETVREGPMDTNGIRYPVAFIAERLNTILICSNRILCWKQFVR